jgi:GR25 family glycosyltransferase involved in LPS biosynthesis
MNLNKIYLINLERRKDRLDHFLNECDRENIDMSKLVNFKAFDAKTYNIKEDELKMFNSEFEKNSMYSKNCMCNQLSHYNILLDIVKKKYKKCVIFQDDVRFKNNFVRHLNNVLDNMPKDSDIIWIGLHNKGSGSYFQDFPINEEESKIDRSYIGEKINNYVCKLSKGINPCSLAYIITYEGAKRYLEYIRKVGFSKATDGCFNDYLEGKGIMYGSYDVLCTGNSKFKSDVFEIDDNAISRDMLDILECL